MENKKQLQTTLATINSQTHTSAHIHRQQHQQIAPTLTTIQQMMKKTL